MEEALANAQEAIKAYLLSLADDGLELPEPDGGPWVRRSRAGAFPLPKSR